MDREEQARRYARLRRRLWAAEMALFAAYAMAWLGSGLALGLGEALARRLPSPLDAMGMAFLFGGGWALLSFPLDFYSGFLLPHRFGLSTQTRAAWFLDYLKAGGISAAIGLPLIGGLYLAFRRWPHTWWLPVGAAWIGFTVVLAQLAPVLLAPLFYRFQPLQDPELAGRLARLAQRAGTRVRGAYVIDMSRRTRAANAGLMAHELAHHLHRDIPLGLALESLIGLAGFFLGAQWLPLGLRILGLPRLDHPSSLPVLAIGALLFGLIGMIPMNAWSRWREWEADREAIRLCGRPDALAAALRKLGEQNLAELDPEPWVEWILSTHPALGKRIRAAEALAASSPLNPDVVN